MPELTPSRGDDGEILALTRQLSNGDQIKFEIDLPTSGRKVESEWLPADMARKAIMTWIDTIKGQMDLDLSESRMAARQEADRIGLLNRVKPKTDNHDVSLDAPSVAGGVLLEGAERGQLATTGPSLKPSIITTSVERSSPIPRPLDIQPPQSNNPDDFARNGLALARADADYWKAVAGEAMDKWQKAQKDVEKWERVLTAIGGGVVLNVAPLAQIGSDTGPPPVVRRRGRPRKAAQPNVPAVSADTVS